MFLKLIFALHLFHNQIHAVRDVTYTLVTGSFDARMLYQRSINDEELCLNICYDHELCKYVHYSEDNCTIYKTGAITYLPSATTYELDRTLSLPSCSREVVLRPAVEFKPLAVQSDENVTCSGLPSELIVVHTYFVNGSSNQIPLYSTSDLMGNFTEIQRLYFAKEPQSQYISVPVFTGAIHSRLYFGDVYNTSGYYFLDAYAFTGKCACETNACCGNIAIDEYHAAKCTLFSANGYSYVDHHKQFDVYGGLVTSKQQFYIADVEWLQ